MMKGYYLTRMTKMVMVQLEEAGQEGREVVLVAQLEQHLKVVEQVVT